MDEVNFDDSAVHGVTDTSGVKGVASVLPEEQRIGVSEVAAQAENTAEFSEIPATGEIESKVERETADADKSLEAEFEALISGRFKEIYKRRTEGIIRKRLKVRKAHSAVAISGEGLGGEAERLTSESESEEEKSAPVTAETAITGEDEPSLGDSVKEKESLYEKAFLQNQNRPLESGLSASAGIVTRVNVSSLDGSGVLDIVRRVTAGEKISFN